MLPVDPASVQVLEDGEKSESSLLTRRIEREIPRTTPHQKSGEVRELWEINRFISWLSDNKVFNLICGHVRNTFHTETDDITFV